MHNTFVLQASIVLQKRHMPDQPLEYLLKLRYDTKSGFKYREKWIAADRLSAEFDVGDALIKQFEASKVGLLGVDTYLTKRRNSPSSVNSQNTLDVSAAPRDSQVQSASKPLKRKSCDYLNGLNHSSDCNDRVLSESLKRNWVQNTAVSPLHAGTATVPFSNQPLPVFGSAAQPVSQSKHFAKRLLLCSPVPRSSLSKSKHLKLPNLVPCKPVERKTPVISCKYEDSDSEDDIRYSLVTDISDTSSDTDVDTKLTGGSEKKPKQMNHINGVKKSKSDTEYCKQPNVIKRVDIKLKTSNVTTARSSSKPGIMIKSSVSSS